MTLQKNQQNLSDWVNQYSDILFRFALKRTNNEESAKDLVQETYLAAWRNVETYDKTIPVKAWLFAILKNKLIDYYRKSSKNITEELLEDITEKYFDADGHWTKSAYPIEWKKADMESKEFYKILQKGINGLKQIQANVFVMKYLDDMSSDKICKILNITPANYWIIMHRAKIQLRSYLEKNWINQ